MQTDFNARPDERAPVNVVARVMGVSVEMAKDLNLSKQQFAAVVNGETITLTVKLSLKR